MESVRVYIQCNNWYLIRMSNMATTAGPGAHLSLWSKSESQATLTAVRGEFVHSL